MSRIIILTSSRTGIAADCLPELCCSAKLSIAGVIVAGAPPGTVGSTNLIHVHRIGEDDH